MKKKHQIIGACAALLMSVGLGVAAVDSTSAYFSDTNSEGSVSVDLGSILVTVANLETETPVLALGDLVPGQTSAASFTVQNTGSNTQDVYITFPDPSYAGQSATELDVLNQLTASQALNLTITAGGSTVYDSAVDGDLEAELLLIDNLAAGATSDVVVSMTVAADTEAQLWGSLILHYNIVATQDGIGPSA